MKTIFIIILIFYSLKLLARYLFPFFLKKMAHNVEQKFKKQQGYTEQETTEVGETVIDTSPQNNSKKGKSTEGEYIDYEEMD